MDVGVLMLFQNHPNQRMDDYDMYKKELKVCEMAEPLGFDSIWAVEHHFTDYTLCPNPVEMLSYLAGKTEKIKLGTGAIIIPWHKDPLRIATDVAMLDNLSDRRVLLGIGRGIGRVEYDGFGVDMNESRGIFDESAKMVLDMLETGKAEAHEGKYFTQAARDIRPKPMGSYLDRTFVTCQSPETADLIAKLGLGMMVFAISPWKSRAEDCRIYREAFREYQGREAPPVVANVFVMVDEDADKARELAHKYMTDYWISALQHYEMDGTHFEGVKGYEFYAKSAGMMRDRSSESMENLYVNNQVFGTPQECIDQMNAIQEMAGPATFNVSFSYAGLPYEDVHKQMKLFAEKCLPVLQAAEPGALAAKVA
ncbi:MAG TPA: LLM class flavin-dependent oxidoreductase [Porticoccaceae bacterium]|nr:LLM class flavin-dependent oxidoreductase [Porticoccaceae bacterium]